VGFGPRRLRQQRLDYVCLVCADHARRIGRRRLFEISVEEWLRVDLKSFQRRWHRANELAEYIREQIATGI
jgi:hypothetical protein